MTTTDEWWVWLPTVKFWQCIEARGNTEASWFAVLHVCERRIVRLGTREEAASW
jgi:hypothetical protein